MVKRAVQFILILGILVQHGVPLRACAVERLLVGTNCHDEAPPQRACSTSHDADAEPAFPAECPDHAGSCICKADRSPVVVKASPVDVLPAVDFVYIPPAMVAAAFERCWTVPVSPPIPPPRVLPLQN